MVAGVAWWLSLDRLTADEQQLVGIWECHWPDADVLDSTITFTPDRLCRVRQRGFPEDVPRRWAVRGGELLLDYEPSDLPRALRPAAKTLGLPFVGPIYAFPFRLTDNGLAIIWADSDPATVYTRAPAD